MKISFVLIVSLLLSLNLMAQDTTKVKVPTVVSNKMIGIFPQTQIVPVTWTKEGDNFKGAFIIMEKPAFAIIDPTGKVVRIERRLHYSYLPKKVIESLNTNYPGNVIEDVYETTDAAGSKSYKTIFRIVKTLSFKEDGSELK